MYVRAGAWILDLLTLPTKFMTKRLKDLRAVFQNSFHHAPCLKFTTKGPLSLKDLQLLTPSQSEWVALLLLRYTLYSEIKAILAVNIN